MPACADPCSTSRYTNVAPSPVSADILESPFTHRAAMVRLLRPFHEALQPGLLLSRKKKHVLGEFQAPFPPAAAEGLLLKALLPRR